MEDRDMSEDELPDELAELRRRVANAEALPPLPDTLPDPSPEASPAYRLLSRYAGAALAVTLATLLRMWLDPVLGNRAPFTVYFPAVMFAAWYGGLGPSLAAIVFGALIGDYLFVEPRGTLLIFDLTIDDLEHQIGLGLYLGVSVVVVSLSELLHRDIRRRKRAEEILRQRAAVLGQYAVQLGRINERLGKKEMHLVSLMELQDRDRQLIGFEIHDELAQLLTGAMMYLECFRRLQAEEPAEAAANLDAAVGLLAKGIQEARRLINGLRPPSLDVAGVVDAISDLVREVQTQQAAQIEFTANVDFQRLPRQLENNIFRVVQEGLMNACRHSHSERIGIVLSQKGDRLQIEVRDWGVGFDPEDVGEGHFGLESIRQRAKAFGGKATVESRPGEGTRVWVELPLSG